MKCITDIKIIIHPSVWHVCVPLHRLVLIFLADCFYNRFISKLYDQDDTPDHTHTHTQLHYIIRDIMFCRHSFDTQSLSTMYIWWNSSHSHTCSGGTWSCIFCNERKIHVCKLMDPWGVRIFWVLSQDWCTYAIMLRYSFFDCCCLDKLAVPW